MWHFPQCRPMLMCVSLRLSGHPLKIIHFQGNKGEGGRERPHPFSGRGEASPRFRERCGREPGAIGRRFGALLSLSQHTKGGRAALEGWLCWGRWVRSGVVGLEVAGGSGGASPGGKDGEQGGDGVVWGKLGQGGTGCGGVGQGGMRWNKMGQAETGVESPGVGAGGTSEPGRGVVGWGVTFPSP